MIKALKRVLIMGGGTGGHVFPGLAFADFLRAVGVDVHWLGTAQGLESRVVPAAGYPLHLVEIKGLRGKGKAALFRAPLEVSRAVFHSSRIVRSLRPDAAVGMGGFVSGPGGLASWLCRCPLMIHEQNAKAGTTNKILARLAKKVLQGFPHTFGPGVNAITVGNPVRDNIENVPPPHMRFSGRTSFHLLVLGGSLGAQSLNEAVPRALALLAPENRPEVLHQSGEKNRDKTAESYLSHHVTAKIVPFIEDMAKAYAWADLVVCRAGALTVAELCSVGLGGVLVPFPYAVDDHQTANALHMADHNAALCVQQKDLSATRLAEIIMDLQRSPEKRAAMAKAAYQLRTPRATEQMFQILSTM